MGKMFLSFVLAAYNEERNVRKLTLQIVETMRRIRLQYEIIYVIDGDDNTYPVLKQLQDENKLHDLKLIYSENKRGFAKALKEGFRRASKKATHIVTMDCDLNHNPNELPKFIKEANAGADIVIGSRAVCGGKTIGIPFWKRWISIFANQVFLIISPLKVLDKSSGYRLIRKKVINDVAYSCKTTNFEYLLEFLLRANKKRYKIKEVPITFTYRKYGKSKFQLFSTGAGYFKLLFRKDLR